MYRTALTGVLGRIENKTDFCERSIANGAYRGPSSEPWGTPCQVKAPIGDRPRCNHDRQFICDST